MGMGDKEGKEERRKEGRRVICFKFESFRSSESSKTGAPFIFDLIAYWNPQVVPIILKTPMSSLKGVDTGLGVRAQHMKRLL